MGRVHCKAAISDDGQELHIPKPPDIARLLYEAIDSHYLLHILTTPCKEALVAAMSQCKVLPGQHVINFGSPPGEIFVLYEGICSVRDVNELDVATLYPQDVFGEEAIIHGTTRSASIVTDSECIFYKLEKDHYAHCLARLDPGSARLRPPSTVYVNWREQVRETEEKMLKLMHTALTEAAEQAPSTSSKSSSSEPSASPLFASHHDEMKEVLSALATRQQLSVIYWLTKPAHSLLLLAQNRLARGALLRFMHDNDYNQASVDLQLVLQANQPNRDAATILRRLEPVLDIAMLSTNEIDERLQSSVRITPTSACLSRGIRASVQISLLTI